MSSESVSPQDLLVVRETRRLSRQRQGRDEHSYAAAVDVSARPDVADLSRVFASEGGRAHVALRWAALEVTDQVTAPVAQVQFDNPINATLHLMFGHGQTREALADEMRYLSTCSQFFLSFRPLAQADLEDWNQPRDYGFWIPVATEPLAEVVQVLEI